MYKLKILSAYLYNYNTNGATYKKLKNKMNKIQVNKILYHYKSSKV